MPYLVPIHKWSFCPISALCEKNNPRNIKHMPAVIFFACLDLEQKSSFMDGHYLAHLRRQNSQLRPQVLDSAEGAPVNASLPWLERSMKMS